MYRRHFAFTRWPWRIDFSRAAAALIASSGSATSISFFRPVMLWLLGIGSVSQRRVRQRSGRSVTSGCGSLRRG